MNVEKLLQAVSAIEEVADAFGRIPEDQNECVSASLQCRLVSLYLIQLAKHLHDGMDIYDALLITAQGKTLLTDMGVPESTITLSNLLSSQAHKE